MSNYSEFDILPEALEVIHSTQYATSGITMTELQPILRDRLAPTGEDLEILPSHAAAGATNESSDHFSQKARNLVSNKSLEYTGLIDWEGDKNRRFYPVGKTPQPIVRANIKYRPRKVRVFNPVKADKMVDKIAGDYKTYRINNDIGVLIVQSMEILFKGGSSYADALVEAAEPFKRNA